MIYSLIYHGWPLHLPAAQTERNLYNQIINQIDLKYPNTKNLVINGTWLGWDFQHICENVLNTWQPDKIFIGSMVDPWEMTDWAEKKFYKQEINYLGNVNTDLRFEFWAIECSRIFQQIDSKQFFLNFNPKLYLCYQNKPTNHRQILSYKLLKENLLDRGILSLGQDKGFSILFDDLNLVMPSLQLKEEPKNKVSAFVPNFGSLERWQNTFLNIISETAMDYSAPCFISEKTWRPIIGLRPFVINGHPGIYRQLNDYGFYTFEDFWPVDIRSAKTVEEQTDSIVQLITHLKTVDLNKLYQNMLPKLQHNRSRYFEFVKEQQSKIETLI